MNTAKCKWNRKIVNLQALLKISKLKTPSDGTFLGRTSEEVFVLFSFCCLCSSFRFWSSFYCHLSILFIHILLFNIIPLSSVDYHQVFRPILYFQPSPSQSDSRHFHFQPFYYLLAAGATVLSGCFLLTGVFLPYAPSSTVLTQPVFIMFPWEPVVLSWTLQGFILTLETQTRPICLFDLQ